MPGAGKLGRTSDSRYKQGMEQIQSIIEMVGMVIDAAGVLVILIGIVLASLKAIIPSPCHRGRIATRSTANGWAGRFFWAWSCS